MACPDLALENGCIPFDIDANSVITHHCNGRLGNQMFTYLILASLKIHFGYQAVVTHAIADTLLPYFEGLDLPEASHLCGFDASYSVFRIVHTKRFDLLSTSGVNMPPSPYPWEVFPNERSVFELASTEYHKGRALILFPQNYSPKVVEFEFYNKAPHIDVILDKAFTVRQGFMDEASAYLIRIAADFRAKKTKNAKRAKKSKQPLTYVGIHSRRTDHLAFEVENNYVELRPSYYLKAMDLFRDKFKNVIFVYISDDVPWGKAKLTPRNKAGDLYFGADGLPEGMDSLGFDLALMKLCNHTIISHGTFSYWVGFLAGGSVITPNHFEEFSQNTECSQGPGAPSADDPESCPSQCEAFDPEAKTFLLRDSNGRLGNQMFAYMLLLSMNMQFGYRPLLSRRTFNSLNPFFANLGMDVAEDVVCDFNETYSAYRGHIKEQRMELIADYIRKQVGHDIELVKDDKGRWKLPPQVANDPNIDTERVIHSEKFKSVDVSQVPPSSYPWEVFTQDRLIMELAKAEYQTGRAVILFPENYSASRNESRFINNGPGVLEALTKTFTLRGHFMESAEVRLNHIRAIHMEKMATKSGKKGKKSKKPITFVGIHSRRTDHLSFEQELGQVPLKPSYYLEAMEMYR
eukprot:maker-scaffold1516_size37830-snap-gene-0.10 protein:Tk12638 transcript:maker-scaffold1516_size37830-snap-gene-0.10-mRNA-1 annotation:"galactoside 2-alpha-l-fucosyltransferase 1"